MEKKPVEKLPETGTVEGPAEKGRHSLFIKAAVLYFGVIALYFLGGKIAEYAGLEYRFWTEALFWLFVWFVPVAAAGILIFRSRKKLPKERRLARFLMAAALILYVLAALALSFFYILVRALFMTTDKTMPDGNLVVSVPDGMTSSHYYAEPAAFFFRRRITFDEDRFAESLSKMYGGSFQALEEEDGETVYVSGLYPDIEVKIMQHGYAESTYLDNNLSYELTSQMLERHRDIFEEKGLELVPYTYDRYDPKEQEWIETGTVWALLITEGNQREAAEAAAEFIRATLSEDRRPDGGSCWEDTDGSIFLVRESDGEQKYESIRNIPFGQNPEYFWIYDENVTDSEILEDISESS